MPLLILVYNILWGFGLALLLPFWAAGAVFSRRLRNELRCRFEILGTRGSALSRLPPGGIWVHAASVGEVVTVMPLIRRLESSGHRCSLLTTSTVRGFEMAQWESTRQFATCVLPPDLYLLLLILFRAVRPKALILVNSEFWLNLIYLARARGVPVLLVNGKLSERSFRAFYRFRFLLARLFLIPRLYLVRTNADRDRFRALGVPGDRIQVVGSLRFSAAVQRVRQASSAASPFDWLSAHPFVIGGSTREGEERVLLEVYRNLISDHPELKLMLVPREMERVPHISDLISGGGLEPALASRLLAGTGPRSPAWGREVLIWDRFGELAHLYPHARIAFIGGSLVDVGGHNPLESALWGVPTMFGPSRFNVVEECEFVEQKGLGFMVRNAEEMAQIVRKVLFSPNGRAERPARLLEDAEAHAQSLERTLDHLTAALPN